MAYLAPAEFVTKMVDAGESKIFMSTKDTVIRAYMAGAILALAAYMAVTINTQLGIPIVGAAFQMAEATALRWHDDHWVVDTSEEPIEARTVIWAAGAKPRRLGVPGEERLTGRGVSHCASCDGPLLRGKAAVVVGAGDSGLQEALTLAQFALDVLVVEREAAATGQQAYRSTDRAQTNTYQIASGAKWETGRATLSTDFAYTTSVYSDYTHSLDSALTSPQVVKADFISDGGVAFSLGMHGRGAPAGVRGRQGRRRQEHPCSQPELPAPAPKRRRRRKQQRRRRRLKGSVTS